MKTILTTAVAVSGTNLVLTLPEMTFNNCQHYCIRIAQDIPATATNLMNVAIQIGGTATLYPIVRKCGHYLYANQVRTRRNYLLLTAGDTQRFVLVNGLICASNCGTLATIPAPATAAVASLVSED